MIDLHTGKTAYPTEAQRNAKAALDEAVARHGEVESALGEALRQESFYRRTATGLSKQIEIWHSDHPNGPRAASERDELAALEAKLPEALAAVNTWTKARTDAQAAMPAVRAAKDPALRALTELTGS